MYLTRSLSSSQSLASRFVDTPKDGPFSGYLVVTNRQAPEETTCCFGTCDVDVFSVKKCPLPQDRVLCLNIRDKTEKFWFIPVLDAPLSHNIYYLIYAEGRYMGFSCTCSREQDRVQDCFGVHVRDVKPRPFDHRDVYQKFRVLPCSNSSGRWFYVQPVTGYAPEFLRRKSWEARTSRSYRPVLEDASGLNASLRGRLPDFSFPACNKFSDAVIVGKWYCPFVFFREDILRYDQMMRKSMFYKMVLEQRWEKIYTCESLSSDAKRVTFSINLCNEDVSVLGEKAKRKDTRGSDGLVWFQVVRTEERTGRVVYWGMSKAVFEKMEWVQKEGGYIQVAERVNLQKGVDVPRGTGTGPYKGFCCYALAESFVLTRLDGSTAMTYKFLHTNNLRFKWE